MEHFLNALSGVVGGYIRGQVVTSACIFVYTLVVLLAWACPQVGGQAFATVKGLIRTYILVMEMERNRNSSSN